MNWDREQDHEHIYVARRIQTLKAIVLADGRKSCAAPISGCVPHWAPAWHLNRRTFLLPPCWSALLKQNFWDTNRSNTRTGVPVQSLLCSDGIFLLLKRSTEGNNITSSSFIWTHYADPAARRALPPWQHSEEQQRRQLRMKWHTKRAKCTKKEVFSSILCVHV